MLVVEIHCQFVEDGMSLQSIAKWYVEFQAEKPLQKIMKAVADPQW
jgi:hypothetical protein